VKPQRQNDCEVQTDPMVQAPMIQMSSSVMGPIGYSTQVSSNIQSSQSQKRPRIASAANTIATMGFSGASHMIRDPS
jgi:hypothetical protein